jgi:Pyridoxamine 5'-phosphate oxidase
MEEPEVVVWHTFAAQAPVVAATAQELFDRFGFVFVATIRADGSPRISAVEVHVVDGHLMLVMVAGSQKARDLARDSRLALQTPVTDAGNPGAEVKLRGVALAADPLLRRAAADAIDAASGWRPEPSWRFFDVDVRAASLLSWTTNEGDMVLTVWDVQRGLLADERRRLDMQASVYRAISTD